ncbi:Sister chromatid cohesion protein 2 [Dinochytrium kinnereticum]|nr:Sister chromatid cohesion protein 2 [Dinochytrium kinnereticum]
MLSAVVGQGEQADRSAAAVPGVAVAASQPTFAYRSDQANVIHAHLSGSGGAHPSMVYPSQVVPQDASSMLITSQNSDSYIFLLMIYDSKAASIVPALDVKLPDISLLGDIPFDVQQTLTTLAENSSSLDPLIRVGAQDHAQLCFDNVRHLLEATNLGYLNLKSFDIEPVSGPGPEDSARPTPSSSGELMDTSLTEMILSLSSNLGGVGSSSTKIEPGSDQGSHYTHLKIDPNGPSSSEQNGGLKGKKRRRRSIPTNDIQTVSPITPTTKASESQIVAKVIDGAGTSNLLISKCVAGIMSFLTSLDEENTSFASKEVQIQLEEATSLIERILENHLHSQLLSSLFSEDEDAIARLFGAIEGLLKDREHIHSCWKPSSELGEVDAIEKDVVQDLKTSLFAADAVLIAIIVLICIRKADIDVLSNVHKLLDRLSEINSRLFDLILLENLPDQIIVMAYSLSLAPFFVEGSNFASTIGLPRLQRHCMNVVISVFSKYPSHRHLIMEEIVGNIVRTTSTKRSSGDYRLRDGRKIQMITALVLQLLQSCPLNSKFFDAVEDVINEMSGGPTVSIDTQADCKVKFEDEHVTVKGLSKVVALSRSNLDAANASSAYILKYLLGRAFPSHDASGKGERRGRKSLGSEMEAEYKGILESFVKDCLELVADVDWPGAIMVASVFSQMMRQALEDKKSDTAVKIFALDWFGDSISKIRRLTHGCKDMLQMIDFNPPASFEDLQSEFVCVEWKPDTPGKRIEFFEEAEDIIMQCLDQLGLNEYPIQGSAAFFVSMWFQRFSSMASGASVTESLTKQMSSLVQYYCSVCSKLSSRSSSGITLPSKQKTSMAIKQGVSLNQGIGRAIVYLSSNRSHFFGLSEYFLSLIMSALRIDIITVRSRAVRALGDIAAADFTILGRPQLMEFVKELLCDPSASVRDSTVQLLGGLLTANASSQIIDRYYPMLIPRILDVGSSVRKRILRLVKDIHNVEFTRLLSAPLDFQLELIEKLGLFSGKILGRIVDEEDTVKDLALRCLVEMWLKGLKTGKSLEAEVITSAQDQISIREGCYKSLSPVDKQDILLRVNVMMHCVKFPGNGPLLEEFMQRVASGQTSKISRRECLPLMSLLTECVAEQVLLQEEHNNKEKLYCAMQLLNIFSKSCPNSVTPYIKMLQIQMKMTSSSSMGPTTPTTPQAVNSPQTPVTPSREDLDEMRVLDDKIVCLSANVIKNAIPCLKNPDLGLMGRIEQDLIGMLSNRSHMVLSAVMPCLCAIVDGVTKSYGKLVRVLKTCYDTLHKVRPQLQSALPNPLLRNIARCLVISSSLLRNFDFDSKRSCFNDASATDAKTIASQDESVAISLYEITLAFASPRLSPLLISYSLQALGHLFSIQPRIMLRDDARRLMDGVFQSGAAGQKIDLIKVFEEFLLSEQSRIDTSKAKGEGKQAEGIDLQVLVGNAEEMGDSGVSSQLMQLYLERVLSCMLSPDSGLSSAAFNVVALILEQGLVHPLNCMPSLVAMQASPDMMIRERACSIYESLVNKHDSFIHTRNAECVKRVFDYLASMRPNANVFDSDEAWVSGTTIEVIAGEESTGKDRLVAVLEKFYSKIPYKRGRKTDFLLTLVRTVQLTYSSGGSANMAEVRFARFVVENLALLEYKTLEEVLHIIYCIDQVLSMSGEEMFSEVADVIDKCLAEGVDAFDPDTLLSLSFRCSKMSMLFILKSHLVSLYGISESKCRKYTPNGAKQGEKSKSLTRLPPVSPQICWEGRSFNPINLIPSPRSLPGFFETFKRFMESDFFVAKEVMSDEEDEALVETVEIRGGVEDAAVPSPSTTPAKRRAGTAPRQAKPKKQQRRTSEPGVKAKKKSGDVGRRRSGGGVEEMDLTGEA